jgi:N-acetylmuramoyl-L-alanine amidase
MSMVRFVLLAAALFAAAPAAAAGLLDLRFGQQSKSVTRVVFDFGGPVQYRIHGDAEGQGRLIVEFDASGAEKSGAGLGHVADYAINVDNASLRVTLRLARTAAIKEHFVIPPSSDVPKHRLVIDLSSADKAAFLASLPHRYEDLEQTIASAVTPAPPAPAPTTPTPWVVVIDPGHGGSDPGAASAKGAKEKTLTLEAGLALAKILNARGGYQVVLTRAGDSRLSLEERSKLAREAGADLFISLHADAHTDPKLRGGSIYTLSQGGAARSARESRAQGDYHVYGLNIGAEAEKDPVVGKILYDKAQTTTLDSSAVFAELLVRRLHGVTPMLNNSHREADLRVLLAPDVPAVLLELAFISNAADVENMTSAAWRQKTMTAVADAIDGYFETRQLARHAANRAGRP